MNEISIQQFELLLKDAPIKPRLKRDIKFRLSTERMDSSAWAETELLPIWNKNKSGGILLVQLPVGLYMLPFDATRPAADVSGRAKPVICDLCYTWQPSSNGGFVTFYPDKSSGNSISLLCCLDLRCSDHVRTKTPAALRSRSQLREHMTNEDRVVRFRQKVDSFIQRLNIQPVQS